MIFIHKICHVFYVPTKPPFNVCLGDLIVLVKLLSEAQCVKIYSGGSYSIEEHCFIVQWTDKLCSFCDSVARFQHN